ncbi:MAG TPA: sugar ABC transporter ATP-binding protein [Solirubrobacteraceae bacterium]|nr:sugar ABC transporter ATP-binding protein [Solirubrobacteraceae bacterium]
MASDPQQTVVAGAGGDLVLTGVRKTYGPVTVLDVPSLVFRGGEVVALVGENGAGKSTMMGIIAGAVQPDAGTVAIAGQELGAGGTHAAQELGITMVSQEFPLVGQLSVAENLLLGQRPGSRRFLVDWRAMDDAARAMLQRVALEVPLRRRVDSLAVAQRQLIEIAKALGREPRVLILDEPTSALGPTESERVLQIARRHAAAGGVVIFVGHRLNEVREVADRIVVLRNGRLVADLTPEVATEERIVREMVGRELANAEQLDRPEQQAELVLTAAALEAEGLGPIDLRVRAGEVVGVAGLMGSGRSRLLHVLMGSIPATAGAMRLAGRDYHPRDTADAVLAGVALIPEDRKVQGLLVDSSLRWNATLVVLRRIARRGLVLAPRADKAKSREIIASARVVCQTPEQPARSLSGGNQQRLIFGRWMAARPHLLLLDEPTRGVDVGAKAEIYRLIDEQRREGMGIVAASSELEELLSICHRIVVMRNGMITAEFDRSEFSKEAIIAAAAVDRVPA